MYLLNSTVKVDTMNKKELSALVDQASKGITNEDDMAEAMKFIRKSFYEKALSAELDDHLGYQKHGASDSGNARNGHSSKTVYSDSGALEIQTPRDRNGDFEPQAIKKRQTRLPLMDAKIIYLYSKGMSTREISETLEELYDTEVSATLISRVTDAVLEQVVEWQRAITRVRISDELKHYIVSLCAATRSMEDVKLAASPRASIALMKVAQAMSLMRGIDFVTPEVIQEVAVDVIAHRLVLENESKYSGRSGRSVVEELLATLPVPV